MITDCPFKSEWANAFRRELNDIILIKDFISPWKYYITKQEILLT